MTTQEYPEYVQTSPPRGYMPIDHVAENARLRELLGRARARCDKRRKAIMRLMREDFDPHPNWELPAGQWDDNAEDVADKIEMLFAIDDAQRTILARALRDAAVRARGSETYDDVIAIIDMLNDMPRARPTRRRLSR